MDLVVILHGTIEQIMRIGWGYYDIVTSILGSGLYTHSVNRYDGVDDSSSYTAIA